MKEKRMFMRFDIPLIMKFRPYKQTTGYCFGMTRNFSRRGFSFEAQNCGHEPMDPLELKIEVPFKNMFISAHGDIVWKKRSDSKLIAGVELRAMDKEARSEIMDYAYSTWVQDMRKIKNNNSRVLV